MVLADSLRPDEASAVPAPAVFKAVQILEVMGKRRGPLTITEVSLATGLAKSSVSNLMTTLETAGMVRRASRGWVLGYRVLELGQSMLASTDLIAEFRRLTVMLPVLHKETVLVAVLDDVDTLYLARHNGQQPIRLATDIGHRLPAVVTSLGKAMLAGMPDDELEKRLARVGPLPQLTDKSFHTMDELRADIEHIREVGYAIDDQQNTTGVTCFGVALKGMRHPTAVSTTLLSDRATPALRKDLITDLTLLARRLSGLA